MKTIIFSVFILGSVFSLANAQVKVGEQSSPNVTTGQNNSQSNSTRTTNTDKTPTTRSTGSQIKSPPPSNTTTTSGTSGLGQTNTPRPARNNSVSRDNPKAK